MLANVWFCTPASHTTIIWCKYTAQCVVDYSLYILGLYHRPTCRRVTPADCTLILYKDILSIYRVLVLATDQSNRLDFFYTSTLPQIISATFSGPWGLCMACNYLRLRLRRIVTCRALCMKKYVISEVPKRSKSKFSAARHQTPLGSVQRARNIYVRATLSPHFYRHGHGLFGLKSGRSITGS